MNRTRWDWDSQPVVSILKAGLKSKDFREVASRLNALSHGHHVRIEPYRARRRAGIMLAAQKKSRRRRKTA